MLQSPNAQNLPAETPLVQSAPAETRESSPPPAPVVVESPAVEVVNDNHVRAVPNKARQSIRQPRIPAVVNETPVANVESREAPEVAAPQFESAKPAAPVVKTNPNTAVSPQVISPSKTASPKAKVIQWP
jgi:hypothetical protein